MIPSALLPGNLPYPVAWIIVTLALIALSTVWPGAALALAALALLSALLLNMRRG